MGRALAQPMSDRDAAPVEDQDPAPALFCLLTTPLRLVAANQPSQEWLAERGLSASLALDGATPALGRLKLLRWQERSSVDTSQAGGSIDDVAPKAWDEAWSRWPERLIFWCTGQVLELNARVARRPSGGCWIAVAEPVARTVAFRTNRHARRVDWRNAGQRTDGGHPTYSGDVSSAWMEQRVTDIGQADGDDGATQTDSVADSTPEGALAALADAIRERQRVATADGRGNSRRPSVWHEENTTSDAALVGTTKRPDPTSEGRAPRPRSSMDGPLAEVNQFKEPAAIVSGEALLAANRAWRRRFGGETELGTILGARGRALVASAGERQDKFLVRKLVLSDGQGGGNAGYLGARGLPPLPRLSGAVSGSAVLLVVGDEPDAGAFVSRDHD